MLFKQNHEHGQSIEPKTQQTTYHRISFGTFIGMSLRFSSVYSYQNPKTKVQTFQKLKSKTLRNLTGPRTNTKTSIEYQDENFQMQRNLF